MILRSRKVVNKLYTFMTTTIDLNKGVLPLAPLVKIRVNKNLGAQLKEIC